jgi:hypothetical protein
MMKIKFHPRLFHFKMICASSNNFGFIIGPLRKINLVWIILLNDQMTKIHFFSMYKVSFKNCNFWVEIRIFGSIWLNFDGHFGLILTRMAGVESYKMDCFWGVEGGSPVKINHEVSSFDWSGYPIKNCRLK